MQKNQGDGYFKLSLKGLPELDRSLMDQSTMNNNIKGTFTNQSINDLNTLRKNQIDFEEPYFNSKN